MKRFLLSIFVLFLLVGCVPSASEVKEAIEKTKAAQSTSTPKTTLRPTSTPILQPTLSSKPTLVPLSDIDLKLLLLKKGDLPSDYYRGEYFEEVPIDHSATIWDRGINSSKQMIDKTTGGSGGSVSVFIYEGLEEVFDAFSNERKLSKSSAASYDSISTYYDIDNVGEEAFAMKLDSDSLSYHNIFLHFTRCHALVVIVLADTSDSDRAISYANKLDARITNLVCLENE